MEGEGAAACCVCRNRVTFFCSESHLAKKIGSASYFFGLFLCCSDPSHVIVVLIVASTLKQLQDTMSCSQWWWLRLVKLGFKRTNIQTNLMVPDDCNHDRELSQTFTQQFHKPNCNHTAF